MQYVRKKPKGFGRNAQIEGDVREGAHAPRRGSHHRRPLEDQFLPGAARGGRHRGPRLREFLLRHFSRVEEDPRRPERPLHYLATWWDVLEVVKKGGYLESKQIAEVESFLHARAVVRRARRGFRLSRCDLRIITLNVNGIRSAASKVVPLARRPARRRGVPAGDEVPGDRPRREAPRPQGLPDLPRVREEEGLQRRLAL